MEIQGWTRCNFCHRLTVAMDILISIIINYKVLSMSCLYLNLYEGALLLPELEPINILILKWNHRNYHIRQISGSSIDGGLDIKYLSERQSLAILRIGWAKSGDI